MTERGQGDQRACSPRPSPARLRQLAFFATFVIFVPQKSNCALILKKRPTVIDVGFRYVDVADGAE